MKLKPKAYSMGTCRYEILYKCAKCAYPFTVANDSWHFCPCCGQAIDKSDEKQKLLDELDEFNTHAEVGYPLRNATDRSNERAITKSNIQYYLGNGWTKEQLIEKGFFKPEDFDDVAL